MDYDYLVTLRRTHPAWRLLASDYAPFAVSFLHRCFIEPNVRTMSEQDLTAKLDDYLFHLREHLGEHAMPRAAIDYLNEWAGDTRGWLRRYYPQGSDEPHYDLTPSTEAAIGWLANLENRRFVGAESRLKLVFDLLREIVQGSETDPMARIAELERRRAQIDAEIENVKAGRIALMDPTQLRERFLQAVETARALLADFRQVEQNFRELDREVRERIATWEGGKGEVLEQVFGEQDIIAESDQGKSFRAFWDFLMSQARQEELSQLIDQSIEIPPIAEMSPDTRIRRMHYDWLTAGEATQRTVARLSEQLRRFLDDQAWLENRRIMTLLRSIEQHALAIREQPPNEPLMSIDGAAPEVELPMDRPLFRPPAKAAIAADEVVEGEADGAVDPLFEQVYVDKERLRAILRQALQTRSQIGLDELLAEHPLEQGVAELVAWLSIADVDGRGVIDESRTISIDWQDASGQRRMATLPAVVFVADSKGGST